MANNLRTILIFPFIFSAAALVAQLDASFKVENSNTYACNRLQVTFLPQASVCPSDSCDYIWNFGDGTLDTLSSADTVKHFYNSGGAFPVSLKLYDRISGQESGTVTKDELVKIYKPSASFSDSTTIGGSYTKTFYQDTADFKPFESEAWKYIWETEDGGYYETFLQEPVVHQFATDNIDPGFLVTLTVRLNAEDTDIIGYDECFDTNSENVEVTDDFFVEGDLNSPEVNRLVLINEEATARYVEDEKNEDINVFYFESNGKDVLSVKIFNQWGSVVYRRDEITGHFSWLGNALNSDKYVPSGTYYFVISSDAADERHNVKGFIQVINSL